MTRVRVVIQARLNSSRLPGKMLLPVAGMPLIELVARRAGRTGHEVVVATSAEQYDALIEQALGPVGVPVFRGSLEDVLGRFAAATADLADDDTVVRLTGDNPVADAGLVDELLAATTASGHVYGRVDIDQVPEGFGAEVFPAWALRRAVAGTTDPYDREHVTPWLRRQFGELLFVPSGAPRDVAGYRATVDCLDDYRRISRLFEGREDPVGIPLADLMSDLVTAVDAQGPRVERRVEGFSDPVLTLTGAERLPQESAAEQGERLRLVLSRAVAAGVTHLEVNSRDTSAALAHTGLEPALTKRIAMIVTVALSAEESLQGVVERTFAELGRRGAAVLLFADVASARRGLGEARRYLADGVVGRLGVDLSGATEDDLVWVRRQPDLAVLVDPAAGDAPEGGIVLRRRTPGGPRMLELTTVDALDNALSTAR